MIHRVIVASKNPVKIKAAQMGFQSMFPQKEWVFDSISVPSEVRDQPMTSYETLQGAINRAANAKEVMSEADFWIGIEGGVEIHDDQMEVFAWISVLDKLGRYSKSKTANFYLPPKVADLVKQGIELGKADDIVFGQSNSKQQGGSVGLLTNGVINRSDYYQSAVVLALIPFLQEELYMPVPPTIS